MTTIPAGSDSHPDLSDIKGNQILSTGFCEGGQRREHPVQGRISQSAWERRLIGTVSCSAFWNSVEQEQCDLRDNRAIQRRDTGGESHRSRPYSRTRQQRKMGINRHCQKVKATLRIAGFP